ncbi:MAG: hypothetical protein WCR42_10120 [bacterium]
MLNLLIISGSCCSPNMALFDEQIRKIFDQAIAETEIKAQVSVIPASTLFRGSNSRITSKMMEDYNKGLAIIPAVLINTEIVSYGVPSLEVMKEALIKFSQNEFNKEDLQ